MRKTTAVLCLMLAVAPAAHADDAAERAEKAAERAEAAAARSEAAADRTEAAITRLERLIDQLAARQRGARGGGSPAAATR